MTSLLVAARRIGSAFVHRRSIRRSNSSLFETLSAFPFLVNTNFKPTQLIVNIRSISTSTALHMSTTSSSSANTNGMLASLSSTPEGRNVELALESLANADAVCFDVDSTVIEEEGIDVLADFLGQGEAVAALTKQAMEGDQKFQDALKSRLDLMKPSKQQIEQCLLERPFVLSPGVDDLIEALTLKGIHVYFVSGGFRMMIEPIAQKVCVAKDRIYANTLLFDADGSYAGFDANEPTSADMGKPKALIKIQAENNYQIMVMVGDGATDAQAKPPANAFIGFGGVAARPAVQEQADWFVKDFQDMIHIVNTYASSKLATPKKELS